MKKLLSLAAMALLALPMLASSHGPTRQQVKETITINATPEAVWAVLKDFASIKDWHPAVAKIEMTDDTHRVLSIGAEDGPTISEELLKADDEKMMITYKITDMTTVKTIQFNSKDTPYKTLPVSTYKSWLSVKASEDGGSVVLWKGKFYRLFMDNPPVPEGQSDKEAAAAVQGVYIAGLEGLKAMLEK